MHLLDAKVLRARALKLTGFILNSQLEIAGCVLARPEVWHLPHDGLHGFELKNSDGYVLFFDRVRS
jgi:hypothetical protein